VDRDRRIYTGVMGGIYRGVQRGGRPEGTVAGRSGGAITGVVGAIKWHYYTAAGIEGYTVTRSKDGQWSLRAQVVLSDAFKMAQRPLTFVAMHAKKGLDGQCVVKSEWRWPILSLTAEAHQLTARLGPPSEE
jgi:hypothetical protein